MRNSKRKNKKGYKGGLEATHKIVYIPTKRKSRAGVEYHSFEPKLVNNS